MESFEQIDREQMGYGDLLEEIANLQQPIFDDSEDDLL